MCPLTSLVHRSTSCILGHTSLYGIQGVRLKPIKVLVVVSITSSVCSHTSANLKCLWCHHVWCHCLTWCPYMVVNLVALGEVSGDVVMLCHLLCLSTCMYIVYLVHMMGYLVSSVTCGTFWLGRSLLKGTEPFTLTQVPPLYPSSDHNCSRLSSTKDGR